MTEPGSADAGAVVYETTVTAVGDQVQSFVQAGILVLFGTDSPAELHDISVLHEAVVRDSGPRAGDVVELGDVSFEVLAAGSVVEENLLNLGHVDFKSDGQNEAKLPGDVCVPTGVLVVPQVGEVMRIRRPMAD
jgi:PTS system glucitol/sorbitol-specific IIA component